MYTYVQVYTQFDDTINCIQFKIVQGKSIDHKNIISFI